MPQVVVSRRRSATSVASPGMLQPGHVFAVAEVRPGCDGEAGFIRLQDPSTSHCHASAASSSRGADEVAWWWHGLHHKCILRLGNRHDGDDDDTGRTFWVDWKSLVDNFEEVLWCCTPSPVGSWRDVRRSFTIPSSMPNAAGQDGTAVGQPRASIFAGLLVDGITDDIEVIVSLAQLTKTGAAQRVPSSPADGGSGSDLPLRGIALNVFRRDVTGSVAGHGAGRQVPPSSVQAFTWMRGSGRAGFVDATDGETGGDDRDGPRNCLVRGAEVAIRFTVTPAESAVLFAPHVDTDSAMVAPVQCALVLRWRAKSTPSSPGNARGSQHEDDPSPRISTVSRITTDNRRQPWRANRITVHLDTSSPLDEEDAS